MKMHIPTGITGKMDGASITRPGEALDAALRTSSRNLRIGKKKPIQRDTPSAPVFTMEKPSPASPATPSSTATQMPATGGSALLAISEFLDTAVAEDKMVFLNERRPHA